MTMGRHAYLIVANTNLLVLASCLRMIDDARNDVYIIFDKKCESINEKQSLLSQNIKVSNLSFLEPIVINWGAYSLIEAEMLLLKRACTSNVVYDYLHLFQGSDLPIKCQDEIHSYFNKMKGKEFVNINIESNFGEYKCWYRHFFAQNKYYRYNKLVKAANVISLKIQKFLHIRTNLDITLYDGSGLCSITYEFGKYLVARHDEICRRFKYGLAADEVFIQTMVMSSPFKNNVFLLSNDRVSGNARLIDWTLSREKNSPHIWTMADKKTVFSQPEGICFARKFCDNIDLEIVHAIEERCKS